MNIRVLTGEELFLLGARVRFYHTEFQKKYPDAEITYLSGKESVQDLWTECFSSGLFADKKLVFTESFWTAEKYEEAQKQGFFKTLADTHDTTLIIIEPKPDKRTKWAKYLLTLPTETFTPLDERATVAWVLKQAKQMPTIMLTEPLAKQIVQRAGMSLQQLHNELTKLATHGGDITPEIITSLVFPRPEAVVWGFTEAVSQRDFIKAMHELQALEQAGESPYMVLSMLGREARIMTQLFLCAQDGKTAKEAAQICKLHPFVAQKSYKAVQQYNRELLEQWYDALIATERKMKTGVVYSSADDQEELWILIEQVIMQVCGVVKEDNHK